MLTAKNIERQLNLFYCRSELEFTITIFLFIYFHSFLHVLFCDPLSANEFFLYFRFENLSNIFDGKSSNIFQIHEINEKNKKNIRHVCVYITIYLNAVEKENVTK